MGRVVGNMSSSHPLGDGQVLSVVIPTYNESHRLPQTLDEILPYLKARFPSSEVIVVDDNSPDGTAALMQQRAELDPILRVIVQPRRLGKGAAVRRGCMAAVGDVILFMDADHATPIHEFEGMLSLLQNRAVVVAVRTYQEDVSRRRRIIGIVGQLLAHLIVFKNAVVDSQCGFKLFSREAAARLFPFCRVNGGMLDVELFFLMQGMGIPYSYCPVHWKNKAGSRINVFRCMLFDPIDMLKIRLRGALGVYTRPVPDRRQPWSRSGKTRNL